MYRCLPIDLSSAEQKYCEWWHRKQPEKSSARREKRKEDKKDHDKTGPIQQTDKPTDTPSDKERKEDGTNEDPCNLSIHHLDVLILNFPKALAVRCQVQLSLNSSSPKISTTANDSPMTCNPIKITYIVLDVFLM